MANAPPDARAILETLVGFDTTSRNSNLELIHWVRDHLAGHGIEAHLSPNPDGTKVNLFATVGPVGAEGGIALSGHTDVVPVDDQDWSRDPFTLWQADSPDGPALYGRGACDMKGFIATALSLVPAMIEADLKTPIHFALSFDEEVGCKGVPYLLAEIAEALPKPALAVIGEPTNMKIANAHKGIAAFRTTVTGNEAHSSRIEESASAIFAAARLIGFLETLAGEYRRAPRDERFDPPHTTFNVGEIAGGTAVNIVPRHCRFEWEFRPLPAVEPEAVKARVDAYIEETLLPEMHAKFPKASVETEIVALAPGLQAEADSPAEALARELTGQNAATTVAFATEAGLFQEAGIPAVVIGPGSIAQAHQPDEYVTLDQLAQAEAFLRKLIERCKG